MKEKIEARILELEKMEKEVLHNLIAIQGALGEMKELLKEEKK